MILTVTLNPALDVTYHVDEYVLGQTHRPRSMSVRAGGKGVNVARVLAGLGEPVVAAGLAGGATGQSIVDHVRRAGISASFTRIEGESRRTVVVADRDRATGVWETGPVVSAAEWATFLDGYPELVRTAGVVVLSGSVPPGLPADTYAQLVQVAATAGVQVILDAEGPTLHSGLTAGPTLVKPNADELADAVGAEIDTPERALAAAHRLRAGRATVVVASLGHRGLVAATCRRDYAVTPPIPLAGNPTGAGDALVAALARGLARGTAWPDLLADAVGVAGGAVVAPVAGESRDDVARQITERVIVRVVEHDADHEHDADQGSECDHASCRNS
ncbi:MAG TPA: hexose kinase [Micromonosporaceae bacterium]|jgi:tagatose 6-phosphate kinase